MQFSETKLLDRGILTFEPHRLLLFFISFSFLFVGLFIFWRCRGVAREQEELGSRAVPGLGALDPLPPSQRPLQKAFITSSSVMATQWRGN